jgi:HD-GYP domain-containing protein (c-di-GMP phosphodiesterase class II)
MRLIASERLIAIAGDMEGQTFALSGPFTIGRNPGSSLQLEDLQVSRRHAIIEQTDRGTVVRDLGSGNGTFVGTRRILEYRLHDGDVISVGGQRFRFESDAPKSAPPPAPSAPRSGESSSQVRFDSGEVPIADAGKAESLYQTFFQAPSSTHPTPEHSAAMRRLQAVYAASQVIASERDIHTVFRVLMEQVFALLPAHNGVILILDRESGELVSEFVRTGEGTQEVAISSSIVQRAVSENEAIITHDAAGDGRFDAGASIFVQNIASAMCAPLRHQDETLGAIYVDTRGTTDAFKREDLQLLATLAGPAAAAIKTARQLRELEKSYEDTLVVLANSIEMRDHYTVGHTWRVTNFALAIARQLGWSEEKLKECEMGGVLHDVGKIAIPDGILGKSERLTQEEFEKMKVHPERGARLLQDVERLHPLIPYCLYHHERVDGKGYPYGLSGDEIPIEGRVVAVADAFDALTSNRPYRKGLDPEVAIGEIVKGRGTQFDATVVDALLAVYRAGKIDRILQDYLAKDAKSIACPFCSTHIQMPEGVQPGDEFDCGVCHRRVRMRQSNDAWFGELLPRSQLSPSSGGFMG